MSENGAAERVRSLADALNEAIDEADELGLRVEVDIVPYFSVWKKHPKPVVMVKVEKAL
jgi:hypothetical protein